MDNPVLPRIAPPNAEQLPPPVATWRHRHQSGQFEVRIDLIRGVGRSGSTSDLALTYTGGRGNGVFGLGPTLNLPAIARGNGRQLPRYRDSAPTRDHGLRRCLPVPAGPARRLAVGGSEGQAD